MKNKNSVLFLLLVIIGIVLVFSYQCKKDDTPTPQPSPPAEQCFKDIDGNVYHYITIGKQQWMAENLKTCRYRDGTVIPNVTDSAVWSTLSTGAYCDYKNNPSNSIVYGRLYNWYAVVNTHILAPSGWHVASDTDWTTLCSYLGGETIAGGKLKENGTAHWRIPNPGATNSTGFTALPGGCRYSNGTFYSLWEYGYWWTSTKKTSVYAWSRNMFFDYSKVGRDDENMPGGFSVRCVKD
ncbi:MAG: fibrobacter succinogenes major paralogous domain-containing protein [Bacteroidetes bacterium]|nr:fibrobacter succinogenes major paralogous domain-containing protein [Bacteroidota bacterium]